MTAAPMPSNLCAPNSCEAPSVNPTRWRFCPRCGEALRERIVGDAIHVDGVVHPACAACKFIAFDSPTPVAGVIVRRDDQALLVRPAGWDGPHVLVSGYLEAYESAEEAAAREVREETGLEVEVERVLGTYSCRPIDKNMVFIVCVARVTGGALRLSPELQDARWFPLDALPAWDESLPVARAFAALRRARSTGPAT
jgi:NAD+ diphosphatase